MQTLNFETLYQNNFFLDFLTGKTQIQKFFNTSFHSKEDFQKIISAKENEEFLREELVAGLSVENKNLNASPKTLQNIELLAQNNTFAVVTGQQAGIFCGPLYTLYKTLTALKLCEQLKIWFPEKNFVPIFWMETEDHDFNEVSKNYFLNQQGQLFEANYTEQPKTKIPVGKLVFTQKIDELTEEIFAKLGTTEFSEELKKMVSESYTKGNTFAESFGRFLHKTLGKFGVITINPHNSFWKEVAGVFFETAIEKNFEISKALFETAKELEKEGYKPQLNLPFENANLFLLLEGERRKLVREKEVFRLVGKKETFEKDELLSLVEVTPNLFVTNVALRPLLQDFLLPTVAYVGGASEITYFAEISKLYEIFEISMPVIFPRNSVLLLEKRISRLLEKSGLTLEDCFVSEKVLLEKVLGKLGKTPNELFFEFEQKINSDFETLKTQLTEIDFVLKDVSEKAFEKILHQLSVLSQKAESSFRTKNENIVSQVSKVSSAIFPDFSAQERKLGILTFYNKYGLDLCEKILLELEPFKFEIQVFELKN